MANINNIKSAKKQFLEGYLSVEDVFNLVINQILYVLTAGYFWLRSIVFGRPGLMQFKPIVKNGNTEKKVLISFVLRPLFKTYFIGKIRYYFSINGLTLSLIRAFRELGYTCHVLHAIDTKFKVKDNYQVVVCGDVANFESLNSQLPESTIKIAFQTGNYWQIHNAKEEERFVDFKKRWGVDMPRDRWANNGTKVDFMFKNSSAILALGDYFTRESFKQFSNVFPIDSAFLTDKRFTEKEIENKNFKKAKNNFIYYGGGGVIHKGQDLIIEVFSKSPHLELYLCNNYSEQFLKVYESIFANCPNIHIVGYLPQRSKGFYDLVNKCAFNLHPSCSEGSPGGVIELLQYGIVPIASYESNIDVSKFGVQLKNNSLEEITQTVQRLSLFPEEEVKKLAVETRKQAFEKFSNKVFLQNLKTILKEKIKIP